MRWNSLQQHWCKLSETIDLATVDEYPGHIDDQVLGRLINDVARKLYTSEEVAARYGLTMDGLRRMLRRPDVLRRARRAKAMFESDENLPDQVRNQSLVVVKENMVHVASIFTDPKATAAQKTEAMKLFSRMGGVDGLGNDKGERSTSAPVSINFKFVHSGQTETFTASAAPVVTPTRPARAIRS